METTYPNDTGSRCLYQAYASTTEPLNRPLTLKCRRSVSEDDGSLFLASPSPYSPSPLSHPMEWLIKRASQRHSVRFMKNAFKLWAHTRILVILARALLFGPSAFADWCALNVLYTSTKEKNPSTSSCLLARYHKRQAAGDTCGPPTSRLRGQIHFVACHGWRRDLQGKHHTS